MPPLQSIIILNSGDVSQVMLTSPLIAALHRAYPQARIDYAVSTQARAAIAAHPHIENRFEVGTLANPFELIKLIRFLRAHHYDAIFIAQRAPLVAATALLSGIKLRIGFNHGTYTHSIESRVSKHQAELYLDLARALEIDTNGVAMSYTPSAETQRAVLSLLSENKVLDKPFILIHVGGANGKRWPPANFAQLIMRLVRESARPIALVGEAGDEAALDTVCGLINLPVINLGVRTLDEVGALAERCELYIGNDTGATHIASGTRTRVLMIMGPSNPQSGAPFGDPKEVAYVWRGLPSGNENGQRALNGFNWSDGVTVEEVVLACLRLLLRGDQLAFPFQNR